MRRILAPVDGSRSSDNAVRHLIGRVKELGGADVHVLHVEPAISTRGINPEALPGLVGRLQRDEEERTTRSAEDLLGRGAVPHTVHFEIGEPSEVIARYAGVHSCDEIIMGTRGMGAVRSLIPGSVATKVLHLVKVPVTLVK